jgi:GTP-binding protein
MSPSAGPSSTTDETALPVVAVVGRPNVGKSTLFNRIVGRREAIVEEKPGVTRDRKEVVADWQGREFRLVDTGGWMPGGNSLDAKVSAQSEKAIAEADVVLFVVDVTVGITEEDSRIAQLLRRGDAQVLLVTNKVDDTGRDGATWEFVRLGLGDPFPVSALHGRGTGDLLDEVVDLLPAQEPDDEADAEDLLPAEQGDRIFSVSIVGRPNVGKSTLFNRLIGDDRSVVHFVDTAGMRRRAKIDEGTEYYSMVRALQAIDRADVALLVIDSTVGITAQDQRLAERVDAAGCPIVVLLNKWEMLDAEQHQELKYQMSRMLHFIGESPVLQISALSGKGVHKLLPALAGTIEDYHRRVPTRKVNQVLRAAQSAQPAPHGAKVLYATQGATDPPTFTLFANKELHHSYLRYLERSLREAFDMGSTPIKLRVRKRD